MPWTKQQQKVIDQRDADILVSAAGSGKDGGTGRTYYTKDHGRKTSDRCGSSACRDIYRKQQQGR